MHIMGYHLTTVKNELLGLEGVDTLLGEFGKTTEDVKDYEKENFGN